MNKKQILAKLSKTRWQKLIPQDAAKLEEDHNETMQCPKCQSTTNLVGSESLGHTVRRMRVCPKCGHKFLSYEIPQAELEEAADFVGS